MSLFPVSTLVVAAAFAAGPAFAGEAVAYRFGGGSDGYNPSGTLVADAAGNIYGTTAYGGGTGCTFYDEIGCGIVFALSPPAKGHGAWTETILYRFQGGTDGGFPAGPLLRGADGTLYGATDTGGDLSVVCAYSQLGCGTIFALSPPGGGGAWTLATLHAFTGGADGGLPGDLIPGAAGSFAGTTVTGGDPACRCGTAFSLTPAGGGGFTLATLYAFTGFPKHSHIGDGSEPLGVVFDAAGNLVGATLWGGHYSGGEGGSAYGTVFTLSPPEGGSGAWTETSLDRFGAKDENPVSAPVIDGQGNIFGTTYTYAYQVVHGKAKVIFRFQSEADGAYPYGGVTPRADGALYGTAISGGASDNGLIYRLTHDGGGWSEAVLYNFAAGTDGSAPAAPVTLVGNVLFGTTLRGGNQGCQIDDGVGCGTVFELPLR